MLGLMDQLVAVSHECDHPEEATRRLRVTHCEIYGKGPPSVEIDQWVSARLAAGNSLTRSMSRHCGCWPRI